METSQQTPIDNPFGASGGAGGTMVNVLCCVCGISIAPNAANTCATCLASSSNITKGIPSEVTLHQCRRCQRWHKEGGKWIACELESRELMSLCLSNVRGLKTPSKKGEKQVRLIDASWIWTEPHSMRLKVRLTIQREVEHGTILQQSFIVTFMVRNQQCTDCQSEFRTGSWKSLVQVRQRVGHKRTFLYLEQLILKHGAHRGCLSIEAFRDGMDFYFPDKGKAARFVCFLESVVPIKVKTSKKLIGTDDKSNISNYKYTNFVEICPLCKDDLLCLPVRTARNLGNISQIVLVKNISNLIHLIDPLSGQTASMNPEVYWRDPIRPIITAARSRMTRFVVLGKENIALQRNVSKRSTSRIQRSKLANLTLAKERDLGINDKQVEEKSHVGYLMKSGDVCAGYDLQDALFVGDEAEELRSKGKIPDVIVLRKLYGAAAAAAAAAQELASSGEVVSTDIINQANKKRIWRLKRLNVDVGESTGGGRGKKKSDAELDDMDEEDFMQELEADKEMRQNMNLYKADVAMKKSTTKDNNETSMEDNEDDADSDDEDDQKITLDELLDNLALDAGPDAADDEEDPGTTDDNGYALRTEGEKAMQDGLTYVGREQARLIKEKEAPIAVKDGVFGKEFDALKDL